MPQTVTVTMTREQAMDIYERLQEEIRENEVFVRNYGAHNWTTNDVHAAIAELKKLAALFEPTLDSLRNDAKAALEKQRKDLFK